jgi:chromosomal replication initiator protein
LLSLLTKEVTIELRKVVEKFVKNVKREISIDYIQKSFRLFSIGFRNVTIKNKKRHVVQARQLAMFFC